MTAEAADRQIRRAVLRHLWSAAQVLTCIPLVQENGKPGCLKLNLSVRLAVKQFPKLSKGCFQLNLSVRDTGQKSAGGGFQRLTLASRKSAAACPPACVTAAEALFVPYAAHRGFPDGSAGLLMASVPVGMLLGNLVVGRLVPPPTRERLVAPLLVLLGAPMVGFALPVHLWLTAGLAFLAGVGFSYNLGLQRAFLDALDPRVRGQAFALQFTGIMTLQGVGPLVTGALAEIAPIALVMAVAGLAPVAIAVAWRFRDPTTARSPAADA